jgi:hypothetical protein
MVDDEVGDDEVIILLELMRGNRMQSCMETKGREETPTESRHT